MKRQRGRGRKPGGGHYNHQGGGGGGHSPNRTLESNGPDGKVRGPAAVIYERYLQLSRDALSSGDRVMSENFLQHAEHYFRMLRLMQPAVPVQQHQPQDRFGGPDGEFEGDEDGVSAEGEASAEGEGGGEGGEQPDVEFPEGQRQQNFNRDGGEGEFRGGRRGRGRRNRYREGGEGGDRGEGGGEREAREDRGEGGERPPREARSEGGDRPSRGEGGGDRPPRGEGRRERGPRDRGGDGGGDQGGVEGFSSGPKPAFLGSD